MQTKLLIGLLRRSLIGVAGTLWVLALVSVFGSSTALAHAHLVSSSPAEGATVAPGLTLITLTFSEEISVDRSSAELAGPNGSAVSGASATVDRADRKKMTIQTPALAEGRYTVKWTAVTEDDNGTTNGTVTFTVSAGGGDTPATPGGTTAGPLPAAGMPSAGIALPALALLAGLLLLGAGLALR